MQLKEKRPKGICWHCVLLVVALLLLAGLLVYAALREKPVLQNALAPVDPDLAALHEFPSIDFADSLYYEKTVASYEGEEPKDVYYYEKDSLGMPTTKKVHESHYYPGKVLFIDGNLSEGANRDGLWYAYHKNGNVQTMAHYKNGKEDGRYTVYYENGNVRYTGFYKDGKRVGEWKFYDEEEKLMHTKNFDNK
jgi:hypothetical protein